MPLKPCLDCGKLSRGPRCPADEARRKQASNARSRPHRERRPDYDSAERIRRAETVRAHRELHGDWCPGWNRPPHASADLTADHALAVAAGGAESGPLIVLCRSCNSSKGAR